MLTVKNFTSKPVLKKGVPDDNFKIQSLPAPAGNYPYHLNLPMPETEQEGNRLVFNMVGDTGGIKSPAFQKQIAEAMGKQVTEGDYPSQFLYHLGDIVYHFGEKEQYEVQFFEPYKTYPAPIYAIAGNHDADVNPNNPIPYHSLDAFTSVFCEKREGDHYFSGNVQRKNQHQPNIYWTLNTELATIIGLYSNVPKFGYICAEQRDWFIKELIRAGEMNEEKAVIVCLHHSPYSADTNHGSSMAMIAFLDGAFEEAGVWPDIVFSGHVHNYQHFLKTYKNNRTVPFIVAGAGGFDELHNLATVEDSNFISENPLFDDVELLKYSLSQHGFLKVILEKTEQSFLLTCEYYTMAHVVTDEPTVTLHDQFSVDLRSANRLSHQLHA
ncbi:metallophosphoesterase family protein [Pedobacter sp.]|uniref:metallophosphoesterase family protein n=1 Tax=Pedobacter sp. TaxID=1411316 RepID=UPI003D7F1FF2